MLFNYLKTTFRGIRKTPIYGLLNIFGLALGIACTALIFLWVEDEFSFDHLYPKRNELYSIRMNIRYSDKTESYTSIPGPLSLAIRGSIPNIVNNSRLGFGHELFSLQDKSTYENGFYVDTSYFSMMQLPFVKGNAAGFNQLHSLVLSEKMARKFFGESDPINKTLRVNNEQDYTVIGVVRDPPQNVSLRFDWLMPVDNFLQKNNWLNYWNSYGITTLLELKPGTDTNQVNQQLTAILRPKDPLYTHASCILQSILDWHLYDNYTNGVADGGQIRYVRLFLWIGWIILIIACINFMNLATARAGQRAREIGVRKTLGAVKNSLIGQFILEALLLSFIALLLAVLLIYFFLPAFNTLVDKHLPFELFTPSHIAGLLGIGTLCGLIAGSYPAFYLSSIHPAAVLKGQKLGLNNGAGYIRKGLVVIQFTISIILIICTILIYQQVQHIKGRNLGYSKDRLLYTQIQGTLAEHFNTFRTELLQTGVVENASLSFSPPLQMWSTVTSSQLTWEGADPNHKVKIHWEGASPEYLSTMGLTLLKGRNFYPDIKSDHGNVIINESLAKMMGKEGQIGALLSYDKNDRYRVIGIVKDYLFNDMYESAAPLVLACDPETKENYNDLLIRLKPGQPLATELSKLDNVFKRNNPGYPVDYQFADEQFDQLFRVETRIGKLAGVFAGLAIFISCLGLFGLAAFTAERRIKEIGIRKVLGATASSLVSLLSKEFLKWVTLSCLIAFPLAWLAMKSWLADYAYRISIHWWVFLLAGIAALGIALLTVSFQAVRAARSNPVKTMKVE